MDLHFSRKCPIWNNDVASVCCIQIDWINRVTKKKQTFLLHLVMHIQSIRPFIDRLTSVMASGACCPYVLSSSILQYHHQWEKEREREREREKEMPFIDTCRSIDDHCHNRRLPDLPILHTKQSIASNIIMNVWIEIYVFIEKSSEWIEFWTIVCFYDLVVSCPMYTSFNIYELKMSKMILPYRIKWLSDTFHFHIQSFTKCSL